MRFFYLFFFLLITTIAFAQKGDTDLIKEDSIKLFNIIAYPNPVKVNEFTTFEIQGGLAVGYEIISYDLHSGIIVHNFRTTAKKIRLSFRDPGIKSVTTWITMPGGTIKKYERKLLVNE